MTIDEARRRLARLESAGLSGERELAPLRSLIAVYGQLERARLELACEQGAAGASSTSSKHATPSASPRRGPERQGAPMSDHFTRKELEAFECRGQRWIQGGYHFPSNATTLYRMTGETARDADEIGDIPMFCSTGDTVDALIAAAPRLRDTCLHYLDRLERARLELACERGEDGPWRALGFVHAMEGWFGPAEVLRSNTWRTSTPGQGGVHCGLLDGIEQACDALGITTTWPRGER